MLAVGICQGVRFDTTSPFWIDGTQYELMVDGSRAHIIWYKDRKRQNSCWPLIISHTPDIIYANGKKFYVWRSPNPHEWQIFSNQWRSTYAMVDSLSSHAPSRQAPFLASDVLTITLEYDMHVVQGVHVLLVCISPGFVDRLRAYYKGLQRPVYDMYKGRRCIRGMHVMYDDTFRWHNPHDFMQLQQWRVPATHPLRLHIRHILDDEQYCHAWAKMFPSCLYPSLQARWYHPLLVRRAPKLPFELVTYILSYITL